MKDYQKAQFWKVKYLELEARMKELEGILKNPETLFQFCIEAGLPLPKIIKLQSDDIVRLEAELEELKGVKSAVGEPGH